MRYDSKDSRATMYDGYLVSWVLLNEDTILLSV